MNLEKIDEQTLVEEELKSINWNAVDEYPSFEDCNTDSSQSTEDCFKTILITSINSTLSDANTVVTEDVSDTLMLTLQIHREGHIKLTQIQARPQTREAIPELDSLMHKSIRELPQIFPASKHGQPVTTEFQLPVVIAIK